MQHLKVGHVSDNEGSTGLSVFLFDEAVPCSMHVCGAAPGTRDVLLLEPEMLIEGVHALLLTGGSAFGLGAANGVMNYLEERGVGFKTAHGLIPIVPTAVIYDLGYKNKSYPTSNMAYAACKQAIENNEAIGSVGVGTGATAGKLIPGATASKTGVGFARCKIGTVEMCVYVVVNALGDVYDAKGHIIAGARDARGFLNCSQYCLQNRSLNTLTQQNTTLAAIFTNAKLSQGALKRLAKAASAGLARAIKPVFTLYDGDLIFAASLGTEVMDDVVLGELSATLLQEAIESAVV